MGTYGHYITWDLLVGLKLRDKFMVGAPTFISYFVGIWEENNVGRGGDFARISLHVWRGICAGCMSDEKTGSKKSRQIESKNPVTLSF
jgi:hypothetical protein